MDINKSQEHHKMDHLSHYHIEHHITVQIPHHQHKKTENTLQITPAESQVSILPLESARIVTLGSKKRRINSEVKFIHVGEENFDSPLARKRVAKIKNVVFRPKLQKFISQQKTRLAALEQTMMLQRQRRLNKEQCIKKIQRLMSPTNIKERNSRKFIRTQDKKHDQKKKFKRVKEKEQPTQEQKLLQGKLLKKLREDPNMQLLSRIPEHMDENFTQSALQIANPESQMLPLFSQTLQESIIEQSTLNNELAPSQSKQ